MEAVVEDLVTAEEAGSPPIAPEMDAALPSPETEEAPTPEPEPEALTIEDPRVQEILKGERARLEESYRRQEQNAQRQAQLQEYERAREAAYTHRVEAVHGEVQQMLKAAVEEGKEPDPATLKALLTQASAGGTVETLEGMESWLNGWVKTDNEKFFRELPDNEALNREWVDAKLTRRPDLLFAVALKVAAASGEARGFARGTNAAVAALKAREEARQKTETIRQASAGRTTEVSPVMGITGQAPRRMTLKQIDDMPTSAWMEFSPDERARMLEEAHKAAGN